MKKALIVSKTESGIKAISSLLSNEGFDDIVCTVSACDAEAKAREDSFELIIINTPLDTETGLELSVSCAEKTKSCVFLVVKQEKSGEAFDIVDGSGVMVISKPINKRLFANLLHYSAGFKNRLIPSIEESEKLRSEMEEMKVINRAKLLLIQCLSMTENQAHRYIEHQAMNMRKSKLDIAKQVIRTYQN
ncbi:MAG: ANTAR domain-containing protein [Ruminococcus sp.]|jgi:response regulator NasT|nr:ANTAR domain-containing protein [Ruminococcus sp.]